MVWMNESTLDVAHWYLLDVQAQNRTWYGESDNTSFDFSGVNFLIIIFRVENKNNLFLSYGIA